MLHIILIIPISSMELLYLLITFGLKKYHTIIMNSYDNTRMNDFDQLKSWKF